MKDSLRGTKSPPFLTGGGEMGALMRSTDWSATSLGPPENWPQSLKTSIRTLLNSKFAMFLWWGPDLIQFYNDAYRPSLGKSGEKHPKALGQKGEECWGEAWPILKPQIDQVMQKGIATWNVNHLVPIFRNNILEEVYWTYSYSPIYDDEDQVGGVLVTVTETTQQVIGERQLALLHNIATRANKAHTVSDALAMSARAVEASSDDMPFALFYLMNQETQVMEMAARAGIASDHPASITKIPLTTKSDIVWPLQQSHEKGEMILASDLPRAFGELPKGAEWQKPAHQAVVIPIQAGNPVQKGALVIGLNPMRLYDESYQRFLMLAASQITTNISNAQMYEQERKRAEALAEVDRAKTVFFNNVSHEFRTPLSLILGPVQEMLKTQPSSGESFPHLEMIYKNGLRLQKLVNNLLDFSRIEAGRIQAKFTPTDLSRFTAELASNFRSAIEKAGLQFKVAAPPLSEPIYVDHDMWEKIVLNLLSNAFKFTFEGKIEVRLKESKNKVELAIVDTGEGIAKKELPHIFERFHRVEGAKSRTIEGSGIGLALVQDLVKLHGGTISVKSTPGKGTEFTISLLKGTSHLPPQHVKVVPERSLSLNNSPVFINEASQWLLSAETDGEKDFKNNPLTTAERPYILLADDNADMRDYVCRLLRERYHVRAVSNGKQALDEILQTPPDLLLTDIMMPEMDGFSLLGKLKANPITASIPVIILSARAGEEARLEGFAAGAQDYIVKPFNANSLVARVSALITANRTRQETENRIFGVFMQAPAIITVLEGPAHVFKLANSMYMEIIGKHRNIIGKPVIEALPEIKGQGFIELLDNVYQTGKPYIGNEAPVKLDRKGTGELETHYVNFIYQPFTNSEGKVEGIFVHGVDVTMQVEARRQMDESNEALKRSEKDFRTLADNISNLCWMAHADGFIYWYNSRWYEYTGTTPEQMKGWGWQAVHDPKVLPDVVRRWNESLANGQLFDMVFPLKGADGEFRLFLTRIVPVKDANGKVLQWFGTNTDITEREELMKQREEFISIASHELKTPLTSVKGYIQLIGELLKEGSLEPLDTMVRSAETNIDKLTSLVNDLLDVSKIQAGKIEYQFAEFPVQEMIEESVREARLLSKKHEILVKGDLSSRIYGDKFRLCQVLSNLLSNAIKYSPQATKIEVGIVAEGTRLTLSVKDYGIGIPEDQIANLFQRFFRVHQSAHQFQGLGLGLYISAEIIKRHGGNLSVESSMGKGSTFLVELPIFSKTVHQSKIDTDFPKQPQAQNVKLARQ